MGDSADARLITAQVTDQVSDQVGFRPYYRPDRDEGGALSQATRSEVGKENCARATPARGLSALAKFSYNGLLHGPPVWQNGVTI